MEPLQTMGNQQPEPEPVASLDREGFTFNIFSEDLYGWRWEMVHCGQAIKDNGLTCPRCKTEPSNNMIAVSTYYWSVFIGKKI